MNCFTLDDFLREWHSPAPTIRLRTSGSTGEPKIIEAEKERMRASARMTCDFLGLHEGDTALLCMSLDYIAGKMMVVRALERNLRLITVPTSGHPLNQPLKAVNGKLFAAMVPLQAWNSLQEPEERERMGQIDQLIIGGGAISPNLEAQLRVLPGEVWSSYGMTETLSHIALRPIREDWYVPLAGIRLHQDDEGCLIIDAPHLCPTILHTHDIVRPHPTRGLQEGGFQVIGRSDNTICSGGIKIQAEEVENVLSSVFGDNIMVTSIPHPKYGEAVVLLSTSHIDSQLLRLCLFNHPYWMPRHIIKVSQLPKTATGKPDRKEAKRIALTSVTS